MSWMEAICSRLSADAAALLEEIGYKRADSMEEIRFRTGCRTEFVVNGSSVWMGSIFGRTEMDELVAALSGYALYSCERQIAEGYIPLPGGHRAGVCGKMTCTENGKAQMHEITSVCIRIARNIPDCDIEARPWYCSGNQILNTLLLSLPGCGKTTMLRSIALYLSRERGFHVCAVDERQEFFGGVTCDADCRLDVLSGMNKAQAMPILIRSMAPQVMVIDEIGRPEDADAVRDAARCGAAVFASAHGACIEDVYFRPMLRQMYKEAVFKRYILLGRKGTVMHVWDELGNKLL